MSAPSKTILISGSTGYLGGLLAAFFKNQGWHVLQATRRPQADVPFDLDHPGALLSQKLPRPVDVFLHAAAAHEVACARTPYRAMNQNVSATLAALDFAVANAIPQFVYLSTFHVFGIHQGVLDEQTPPTPRNVYGLSHLLAEQCVAACAQKGALRALSVRPSNGYGLPVDLNDFHRWTLTPFAFVQEAMETGKIVLRSAGHQKRNFLYAPALCALVADQLARGLPHPLLHAPGRETITIRQLAALVQKVFRERLGKTVTVQLPENAPAVSTEPEFSFVSLFEPPERHSRPSDLTLEQFLTELALTGPWKT